MSIKLTPALIRRISQQAGHGECAVVPQPNGTWWNVSCSCGYRSTRRRTAALASDAALHHIMQAVQAFQASGRELPDDSQGQAVAFR